MCGTNTHDNLDMEIQGWLHVCDIQGIPAHQLSCGQSAPTVWLEKYCSLSGRRLWMMERVFLDQCTKEDEGKQNISSEAESYAVKEVRPVRNNCDPRNEDGRHVHGDLAVEHSGRETAGSMNFIQKRIPPSIRRNRNIKHNFIGKENRPYADSSAVSQSSSVVRQPESEIGTFFTPTTESPDMLDLSAEDEAIIRPLHQSILGKEHCFEVITVKGSRCFCCKSAGEREAWIEKLKRTLNPNLDNVTRIEHQLNLWIQEAKGVPVRKKYFCEICLDRQLFARTTSKMKDDNTTFWGEHFEFMSIPDIEDITIHLYKDSDKKKKKDKDYIGLVNISIKSLLYQRTLEKWYTLSTPSGKNKNNSGEVMAVRIKARFQSVCVLPMDHYKELGEIISRDYMTLCKMLRSSLSVAKKDELARSLVCVMQATGTVKEFLTEIVMNEIANVEEESLIFRENTIATKAVEHYLKLVGMGYLHEALGDFIYTLYESDEDCEVDGNRLPANAILEHNQKNLKMCCDIAMCKIITSIQIFPGELRDIFSKWHERCAACNRPRIATRLITASLFLRLICPAILNPSLFGLANEIPRPNTARTLTLVAKVIQNLANRSRFGDKEEYMKFMNGFVREQWDKMGRFLNDVSDSSKTSATSGFKGFIDLGRELAKLHAFLAENLQEVDQSKMNELTALPRVISNLSNRVAYATPGLKTRKEINSEHSFQAEVPEIDSLEEIAEDVRMSSANDSILVSAGSRADGKSNENNAKALDHSSTKLPDVRGTNHGSLNSLSGSESFNNSNNSQKPLGPLENFAHHAAFSSVSTRHYHGDPPISFSNPAYRQYGSLALERGAFAVGSTVLTGSLHDKQHEELAWDKEDPVHFLGLSKSHNETSLSSTFLQGANKGQTQPISFSNPLQGLQLVPGTNSLSAENISQSIKGFGQRHKDFDWMARSFKRKKEVVISNANGNDMCSNETESVKGSCKSDDTLSSRPSSTSTESIGGGGKNRSVSVVRKERVQCENVNFSPSTWETSMKVSKDSKGLQYEDLEGKVAALATSFNTPVSSARHRTGLQKQQQHSFRPSKAHAYNHSCTVSIASSEPSHKLPHAAPFSATSAVKNKQSKSHQAKCFETGTPHNKTKMDVVAVVTRENDDQGGNAPVVAFVATRARTSRRTRPGSASSNNSQVFLQPVCQISSERCANRRKDHHRLSGPSVHPTTESSSLQLETQEGPLSPEERTAQWVLSSIASVPKDIVFHPTAYSLLKSFRALSKNQEDMSRFKKDIDAICARLSEAEESAHALRGREESLLEQLKEGDRREARLLEKLKSLEIKLSRHMRERDDEKLELLHRVSEVEGDKQREREEMRVVVDEKDAVLSAQRRRIASLEEKNAHLARRIEDLGESIKRSVVDEETSAAHSVDQHFHNSSTNDKGYLPLEGSRHGFHSQGDVRSGNSVVTKADLPSGFQMASSSSLASSFSPM